MHTRGVLVHSTHARHRCVLIYSAMVTSTSTPGSMLMLVICFTTSAGECRSMRRLWMRSSNRSHVLVPGAVTTGGQGTARSRTRGAGQAREAFNPRAPTERLDHAGARPPGKPCRAAHAASPGQSRRVPSPQGDLRVVMRSTLVGMRTGPLTRRRFSFAPLIRSAHTFSRLATWREESVMRMRCTRAVSCSPALPSVWGGL